MAVISTIEGERNRIPRRGGEIRGHFPSASAVDKRTEKEGVTSGESDSEFPPFILNKCAEMLNPIGGLIPRMAPQGCPVLCLRTRGPDERIKSGLCSNARRTLRQSRGRRIFGWRVSRQERLAG